LLKREIFVHVYCFCVLYKSVAADSCEIKRKLANLLTSFEPTEHKLFLKQNNERTGGICSIFLLNSEDSCHGISNKKGVYCRCI